MNTRTATTDVELCAHIAPKAADHYRRALDVMTAYPDYAKTQFRIVIEHLTTIVAGRAGIDVSNSDLYQTINTLHDCQAISHPLRNSLHEIRKAGNDATHSKKNMSRDEAAETHDHASQLKSAKQARETLVDVLESIFLLVGSGTELPKVSRVEVGDSLSQLTLWKAVSTLDFEAKMAAALILEGQAYAPVKETGFLVNGGEYAHIKTTQRMASELYWAACEISAELGKFGVTPFNQNESREEALLKYADTEALYRFGSLTYEDDFGGTRQRLGLKAIQMSASRFYAEACGLYGDYLRVQGNYEEAYSMFETAIAKGDLSGFAGMALLYSTDEWTQHSLEKTEHYLLSGIERGCSHCSYLLGSWLHAGQRLNKDVERGNEYLTQAAEAGHPQAKEYIRVFSSGLIERITSEAAKRAEMFTSLLDLSKNIALSNPYAGAKHGRNDPCPCGSRAKYKKCHGK